MRFQLPVLPADTDLNQAFGELYERGVSAVVVASPDGEAKLIDFDRMVQAAAVRMPSIGGIDGVILSKVTPAVSAKRASGARTRSVGLVAIDDASAELFSNDGTFAANLMAASTALRCDRPGKPPGRPARTWYHYYSSSTQARPYPCTWAGCTGMVR